MFSKLNAQANSAKGTAEETVCPAFFTVCDTLNVFFRLAILPVPPLGRTLVKKIKPRGKPSTKRRKLRVTAKVLSTASLAPRTPSWVPSLATRPSKPQVRFLFISYLWKIIVYTGFVGNAQNEKGKVQQDLNK